MSTQTTLGKVREMLKAELGYSLATGVGVATDLALNIRLSNKQKWLSGEYDWPFLRFKPTMNVAANAQYVALAGDFLSIDYERPVKVEVFYTNTWQPVDFGITSEQYDSYNSEAVPPQQNDPIRRWDYRSGVVDSIEVWPIPVTVQKVRFSGQRALSTLLDGSGDFDDSKKLDLDDQLVVLFTASDILLRENQKEAKLKLDLATERLARIRASYPSQEHRVVLGQPYFRRPFIKNYTSIVMN